MSYANSSTTSRARLKDEVRPKEEVIKLSRSEKPDKKFKVIVGLKTIHFGARGMSDYTINRDPERKRLYISRHKARENWSKSGIKTAGFWSRWLLWNKPTLDESIQNIQNKFRVRITFRRNAFLL